MKQFFKDYKALVGEDLKFYKKHWKGSLALSAFYGIGVLAISGGIGALKDAVEVRRCQKKLYKS